MGYEQLFRMAPFDTPECTIYPSELGLRVEFKPETSSLIVTGFDFQWSPNTLDRRRAHYCVRFDSHTPEQLKTYEAQLSCLMPLDKLVGGFAVIRDYDPAFRPGGEPQIRFYIIGEQSKPISSSQGREIIGFGFRLLSALQELCATNDDVGISGVAKHNIYSRLSAYKCLAPMPSHRTTGTPTWSFRPVLRHLYSPRGAAP